MRSRILYNLAGTALGIGAGILIGRLLGFAKPFWQLGVIAGPAALWWAERRGRVPSVEDVHRPITLSLSERHPR